MKISGVKISEAQLSLFDRNDYLSTRYSDGRMNHGRCRTAIGDYFEQLTARLLGGQVHKTDCRCDYCPDVSRTDRRGTEYFEVKGVGHSNQAFVYEGRFERDKQFAHQHRLSYVIWRHGLATTDYDTVGELLRAMPSLIYCMYIVPFERFAEVVDKLEVQKLNSAYGKSDSNPIYGAGYRIPLSLLARFKQSIEYDLEEAQ